MFHLPTLQVLTDSNPGAVVEENADRIPAKMSTYCAHNYSADIFHDYAVFRDRSASAVAKAKAVSKSVGAVDGEGVSGDRDRGGGGGRGRGPGRKSGRGRGRGRGRGGKRGVGGTGGHGDDTDDVTDPQDEGPDPNPGVSAAEGNGISDATHTPMDCGETDIEPIGASADLLNPLHSGSVQIDGGVDIGDSSQLCNKVIVDVVVKGEGNILQGIIENAMSEVKTEGLPNGVTKDTSVPHGSQSSQGVINASVTAATDTCTTSLLDTKLEVQGQGQGQGEIGDCEQDRKRRKVGFVESQTASHSDADALAVLPCREERGREAKAKNSGKAVQALQVQKIEELSSSIEEVVGEDAEEEEDRMVQCNECFRWVHALCEGIDQSQYEAMTRGTHPVWVRHSCPTLLTELPHLSLCTSFMPPMRQTDNSI